MKMKVYHWFDPASEPVEIGQCDRVKIGKPGPLAAPVPVVVNGQYTFEFSSGDVPIYVDGWQTPTPSFPTLQPDPFLNSEGIVIAAMLKQFGGSMTISPFELIEAQSAKLEIIRNLDPAMTVVRLKED